MTDHAAEQEMELEALEAILMDEISPLVGEPPSDWPSDSTCYRIVIRNDEEVAEGVYEKKMDLLFAHTPNYPDEAPWIKLSSVQGMTEADIREVNGLLKRQVEANLGMAMVYTLVDTLKDWLMNQVAGVKETEFQIDDAELEKRRIEAEEKRLAELRALGTPVTVETFAAWKQRYDAEKRLERQQLEPELVVRDKGLSGKVFFQSQEAKGLQIKEADEELGEELEEESDGTDYQEEEEDFDDEDEDDDEDELLDELLAQKGKR
jgi:hypothetical protein